MLRWLLAVALLALPMPLGASAGPLAPQHDQLSAPDDRYGPEAVKSTTGQELLKAVDRREPDRPPRSGPLTLPASTGPLCGVLRVVSHSASPARGSRPPACEQFPYFPTAPPLP